MFIRFDTDFCLYGYIRFYFFHSNVTLLNGSLYLKDIFDLTKGTFLVAKRLYPNGRMAQKILEKHNWGSFSFSENTN